MKNQGNTVKQTGRKTPAFAYALLCALAGSCLLVALQAFYTAVMFGTVTLPCLSNTHRRAADAGCPSVYHFPDFGFFLNLMGAIVLLLSGGALLFVTYRQYRKERGQQS